MVAISASSVAQEKKYKPLVVRAPDGVTIAAQEWGNPAGPEILFIHGFSQSLTVMAAPGRERSCQGIPHGDLRFARTRQFRQAVRAGEATRNSKAWADEVQAVIDAANFKRPVLVGWSYGVHVIADYLTNSRRRSASRVSTMSTE